MRTILLFAVAILFFLSEVQSQDATTDHVVTTDSFQVAIFNASLGGGHGPKGSRGRSYIATGYIVPWQIYQDSCDSFPKCGFMSRDSVLNDNGTTSYFGTVQDTSIIIGEWDCRGMLLEGDNGYFVNNGGLADNSTQTFIFYDSGHPLSPCPDGCTIITEGPVTIASFQGPDDNIWFDRTIAGATNKFKSIRGDVEQVVYSKSGQRSSSGHRIQEATFRYTEIEEPEQFLEELDVSVNAHSLTIIGPTDSLGNPGFGANLTMQGVIYEGGTLDSDPNGGMDSNGQPTLDSIGKWTARGWWISNRIDNNKPLGHNYTLEDGFFMANQQTFEFNHPMLGPVQLMTEGRDFSFIDDNEPVLRAVVGATDALTGHRGESIQELIGINASGGFNFSYSFETQQVLTNVEEPVTPQQDLTLYPNPATNQLTVVWDQVRDPGTYAIDIHNATGQVLQQRQVNIHTNYLKLQLDVSALPVGWYSLVLKKEGEILESEGFSKVK